MKTKDPRTRSEERNLEIVELEAKTSNFKTGSNIYKLQNWKKHLETAELEAKSRNCRAGSKTRYCRTGSKI